MKYLSRVVWSEGMYLGPHHFQAQSRYFEDAIRFATAALWFEAYGLVGCTLDAEAMYNGTLSLTHARGVFSDGMTFDMPDSDPKPATRKIADAFPPARDSLLALLAVPSRKPEGLNTSMQDDTKPSDPKRAELQTSRFRCETVVLFDETTGRDEKGVNLGLKNIRLILESEVTPDLTTLPIARVLRDGGGHFIFDPDFIPPCLQISASERLMQLTQRLVEILEDKSNSFARSNQANRKSWAEFSTSDIANFWLLHTVNSALAPLRHQLLTRHGHPEDLYSEMLRLGGALCTFALDTHPSELPLYDHKNLTDCFGRLDTHIRVNLETIAPSQFLTIPFTKRADYFYQGDVTDTRCFARSQWIFAIRCEAGEVQVVSRTPRVVKLCSKGLIPDLVKRAMAGMELIHLQVPPSSIPRKIDYHYFSVNKSGPCWDHLVKTRVVGLYIPGELPDPDVELYVVMEAS